jgi:hypothetical protein
MKKRIPVLCATITIILIFSVCAQAYWLPDTGQKKCYDSSGEEITCAGTGQDGEYTIHSMSYTINGDGTVTDKVTGLMWQRCTMGQNNDQYCTGNAKEYNWYQASGTYHKDFNPEGASACAELNSMNLAGYNDWRLPAKRELLSIGDYSALVSYLQPTINKKVFTETRIGVYWTSSVRDAANNMRWGMDFSNGSLSSSKEDGDSEGYVRCVRGDSQVQSFKDNGDGTVTDKVTGLMWQKCSAGQNNDSDCSGEAGELTWDDALKYCNALNLGGRTGWRLPNIKELESITSVDRYSPAIDITYFPNTARYRSWWSSTSLTDSEDKAWYIPIASGSVSLKSSYKKWNYSARCVRGGISYKVVIKVTVASSGEGEGRITSNPSGISYSYPDENTGSASFSKNETLKIKAKAKEGFKVSWKGTCAKMAGSAETGNNTNAAICTIKATKAAKVKATFMQRNHK